MVAHLLLDFETMGQRSRKCAAIDLAALSFDFDRFTSNNPYGLDAINEVRHWKLSVADQVNTYGYDVDKETVAWWMGQAPEVKARIKPKDTDLTLSVFAKQFHEFLIESPKFSRWWSRSNTFDPIILERIFESTGRLAHLNEYLKHWQVRDVRTYIDAKFNFSTLNGFCPIADEALWNRTFKQHNCEWDVVADLLRFQAIIRAEEGLEQI